MKKMERRLVMMKTVKISYNPYKMKTEMIIDDIDVCQNDSYSKFKEFIENKIPLQTWIEPIPYKDWQGFVNEVSDPDYNDEVKLVFSGRTIDFDDLQRSISHQNEGRSERTRVVYHYDHKKVLDDKEHSKNIKNVVDELKSVRFRELVDQRTTEVLKQKYDKLDENYKIAKDNVFYIVFAGVYSSGKSTLLNAIIRHDVLPTSSGTCTSKNCRIRHDSSLGTKISLAGYGAMNEESGKEPVIIEKKIYDNDKDCAAAFLEICPIKEKDNDEEKDNDDKYPNLETMEIGVDLSHLYPKSVNKENFTIVLIDTPGMDSAQSIEDGSNKHAEIALEAIGMENKPMIILCVDANKYEDKSIGEFMREIVVQAKEEGSGFNDRFLFLMNKSDQIVYNGATAETEKKKFSEYLTDSSKWNIKGDEVDLQKLAEEASHFVPRVFMTASLVAIAIQKGALDFTAEELKDPYKDSLNEILEMFKRRICVKKRDEYFLSRYCDIPDYRKDEIEAEFEQAFKEDNSIRATELQCGLVPVELAIKDYIERYAYPIKVHRLLDTFEDILKDVKGFNDGILNSLREKETELGEKNRERKEASERKESANEKLAALEKAKGNIEEQLEKLNKIEFDSNRIRNATAEFRADIETDKEITFIRQNPKVNTGQKSREEVKKEIDYRISKIEGLFNRTLLKTNKELEEIKKVYDEQILEIFGTLNAAVEELESSGVFEQGEYKFKDGVFWKTHLANIDVERFASELKENIVDRSITEKKVRNHKKDKYRSSWNPIKFVSSFFMDDYETVLDRVDGYYETTPIRQSIDEYLKDFQRESTSMENDFRKTTEDSKKKVRDLIVRLIQEVTSFLEDIKEQETRIEKLGKSIPRLDEEIKKFQETQNWLNYLIEMIEGV
jgi:GTPase SAR1 family protein